MMLSVTLVYAVACRQGARHSSVLARVSVSVANLDNCTNAITMEAPNRQQRELKV